ncbi:MAG TPA: hypothetical protein VGY77_01985 [Gemmataceae bacterium]|nr:hypothetical protein [Gemmataceae bacterium]
MDIGVFLGSAVVSLAALGIGSYLGYLDNKTPDWTWVPAFLLIDIAHVWATGFRTYFDRKELLRRPWLYSLVPVIGLFLGIALYSEGHIVFWRVLAYLAVFHFVRQQYGWVALYRAKLGERDRLGYWIDSFAIYLATLYPLIYWHSHLPRDFWWFVQDDFTALPPILERLTAPVYWSALGLYALRSLKSWFILRRPNPGKDIVVVTTAVCWYAGIVAFNSDYSFTVTNVFIHGVPYLALVYWYRFARSTAETAGPGHIQRLTTFLGLLWLLAYGEEMLWDRGVWHERAGMFGASWDWENLKIIMVPLLALPQFTHYILDGFIWRRKSNPDFTLVSR